jgi:hypothetical protein
VNGRVGRGTRPTLTILESIRWRLMEALSDPRRLGFRRRFCAGAQECHVANALANALAELVTKAIALHRNPLHDTPAADGQVEDNE